MSNQTLPVQLQRILQTNEALLKSGMIWNEVPSIQPYFHPRNQQPPNDTEVVFSELLPVLGDILQCDRCFLYLRNPHSKLGKVTHCWRRSVQFPNLIDAHWKPEPDSLPQDDPLFAAALRAEPSIFVEDVETANPQVVNREFERRHFGHRALVHAHLRQDGLLWGILQPCIFNHSRIWTEFDRSVIAQVEKAITPLAIAHVKAAVRGQELGTEKNSIPIP